MRSRDDAFSDGVLMTSCQRVGVQKRKQSRLPDIAHPNLLGLAQQPMKTAEPVPLHFEMAVAKRVNVAPVTGHHRHSVATSARQ